jgi:hypothetical protein
MHRFRVISISACAALVLAGCGEPDEELPLDEPGVEEQEAITCEGPQGDAYGNGPDGAAVIAKIREWFGTGQLGDTAIRVAKCNSGYWANCCTYGGGTKAGYGISTQYKGLFQMGEAERAQYGFNWCAGAQVKAAYQMWQDRGGFEGTGWNPWGCY